MDDTRQDERVDNSGIGACSVARVFYCGGLSGRLGTLRAVIPVANLQDALSKGIAKYVGKSFPKMRQAGTVIEVVSGDQGIWKAGFYRATKGPLEFEEHLRGL